jgi:hypothetical protein
MTMQLIETKTLGTAAASIEFTSIPQNFTDLVVLSSLRSSRASTVEIVKLEFNAVTTGYTYRELVGDGGVAASSTGSYTRFALIPGTSNTANTFSNDINYIPNYTASAAKTFSTDSVNENNATGQFSAYINIVANAWTGTAAITSFKLTNFFSSNFIAGSTVSLYGVLKGSGGATVS